MQVFGACICTCNDGVHAGQSPFTTESPHFCGFLLAPPKKDGGARREVEGGKLCTEVSLSFHYSYEGFAMDAFKFWPSCSLWPLWLCLHGYHLIEEKEVIFSSYRARITPMPTLGL